MSLPRPDPNFTMDELQEVGRKFLKAGFEYFEAAHKAGISGAVIWLTNENDNMAIFTRGEYRSVLLRNIEEIGQVRHFGCVTEDV